VCGRRECAGVSRQCSPGAVAAVSVSRSALPSPLPLPEPGRLISADPDRARTPAHLGSCCAPAIDIRKD
jgi:hypothetical protein